MSYTQGGEEAAILEAIGGLQHGLVLDIGAAHPTTFSNSRALIERGWNAILVEASPDHFLSLFREYKDHERVDLILAAVSVSGDCLQRLLPHGGSGLDDRARQLRKVAGPRGFRWRVLGCYRACL